MTPPKVLVATLTWNQRSDTVECLASLQKMRYPNFEILVVDNASQDGTVGAVRSQYPQAEVLVNDRNVGSAEGMNCAIRRLLAGDARFLFLIGNDSIVDPDILKELVDVAETDGRIGIVCPKVYYYDRPNVIWFGRGANIHWRTGTFTGYVQNVTDDGSHDADQDFDNFPGWFTFVRREALAKPNFLDPDYFIHFDDSEWYLKIKRDGWRFAYAPKAKAWHKPSSSLGIGSPAFYYYRIRNRLRFMRRNARVRDWFYFVPFFCYEYLVRIVYPLVRSGKWPQLSATGRGLLDFFRGRGGPWKAPSQ